METADRAEAERGNAPSAYLLARGLRWRSLSLVVGQGSWYASLLVLAVVLAPRDFGIVAVSTAIVSITTLLMESGTMGAIVVRRDLDAAAVRRSVIRTTLAGTALSLLVVLSAEPLVDLFAPGSKPAVLRWIILTVALAATSIVPNALLDRALMFKRLSLNTMAAAVVASVAAIGAAALGAGVWALVTRLVLYQLMLTVLLWVSAARLIPRERREDTARREQGVATSFLVVGLAGFVAFSLDNLLVGALTDATQLGYYALAFSLAYAPLTQISWTVGGVLFPAVAATQDTTVVQDRTVRSLRLMALVLLPLAPVAIALAPGVIVGVLGQKWDGMVAPFQILILAGVGQGVLNMLSETLAGSGGIGLRARIDVVWAVGTAAAIVVAVQLYGIRGAALAHVITFTCAAMAYVWWGGRQLRLPPRRTLGALSGILLAVVVQAAVTVILAAGMPHVAGGQLLAGVVGAAGGILALGATLLVSAPDLLREGRGMSSTVVRPRLV